MVIKKSTVDEHDTTEVDPKDFDTQKVNEQYWKVVDKIVETSKTNLEDNSKEKRKHRDFLLVFFCAFLLIQFVFLIMLLVYNSFQKGISDSVLLAYISSVFVETCGLVLVMVRFSFASKDEVDTIKLMTEIVKSFKFLK